MKTVERIRMMLSKGIALADALEIAEAFEQDMLDSIRRLIAPPPPEPTTSKAAQRTARWRAKKASPTVTGDVTVTPEKPSPTVTKTVTDRHRPSPLARGEDNLLPLETHLPSEPKGSSGLGGKPKKATVARSRFCPPGWSPTGENLSLAAELGFSSGETELELKKMREHEFKDPKTDWSRTFCRWLRTAAERNPRDHQSPNGQGRVFGADGRRTSQRHAGPKSMATLAFERYGDDPDGG